MDSRARSFPTPRRRACYARSTSRSTGSSWRSFRRSTTGPPRACEMGGRSVSGRSGGGVAVVGASLLVIGTAAESWAGAEADSIRYTVTVTDVHRVGLTVTNYGSTGSYYVARS